MGGSETNGGDSKDIQDELKDIKMIFSADEKFAALKDDGNVIIWGGSTGENHQIFNIQDLTTQNMKPKIIFFTNQLFLTLVAPDKEETAKIQLINEDQYENEVKKKLKQELHNKMQNEELNSLMTKSENTISSMPKENNQKDYEIQILSEQLKEKPPTTFHVYANYDRSDPKIIAETEEKIAKQKEEIEQQIREIEKQKKEISQLTEKIEEQTNQLAQQNEEITRQKDEIKTQKEEIETKEKQISEKNAKIKVISENLDEKIMELTELSKDFAETTSNYKLGMIIGGICIIL